MSLYLVLLPFVVAFSLANTEQCVSSAGSSIDLSLHSLKNASGHWIIKVDTRRITMKESPRELTVNVHQETRSCDSNEIEQFISVAFVYPSLHDTSLPGAIEPSTTSTTASTATTSTPASTAPSSDTTSTAPSATATSTTLSTTTSSTAPNATKTSTAPSTTTMSTAPSATATSTAPSTTTSSTVPSTTTTSTAPSTTTTSNAPSTTTTSTAPSTTTTSTAPTATSTTRPKSCPHSGYQLFPEFNCYKISRSKGEFKTWSEAREQCRGEGGDLMLIETERERKEVYIPLRTGVSYYVDPWVGVHIPDGEEGWMTVKGEPAPSTWWSYGYPTKDAAHKCALAWLSSGLLWNYDCSGRRPFICEILL